MNVTDRHTIFHACTSDHDESQCIHTHSHGQTHPIPCLQVLALFAGQPYDSELGDLGNLDAHLTNTCRLEGGVEEGQAVRLLSELPQVSMPIPLVSAGIHTSFKSQNVCFNSNLSSFNWSSKLRNAWGQEKRISALYGDFSS